MTACLGGGGGAGAPPGPIALEACRRHGLELIADSAQGFGGTLNDEHAIAWADAVLPIDPATITPTVAIVARRIARTVEESNVPM